MTITLDGYHKRFDPADNYEKILFRSGKGLQSTELNDMQEQVLHQVKKVSDTVHKDGDVVQGGDLVIDTGTGAAKIGVSSVYIRGSVRELPAAEITVPITDTHYIGVWLTETVVTEVQDPDLLDPVSTARNYKEPGAGRLKIDYEWGLKTDTHTGTFYPVFRIENAVQVISEPPAQMDAITTALARFDRDNSGGSYVVTGMEVVGCADDVENRKQVISITEGKAHIEGFSVRFPYALRKSFDIDPDLQTILNEPITFREDTAGSNTMVVSTAFKPIKDIQRVSIVKTKTADVLRGADSATGDPLPDSSISEIISIVQDTVTYVRDTDWERGGVEVKWLPDGNKPASSTTYSVTYTYMSQVAPTDVTDTGFTVSGADEGSNILVDYQWKMPRIDVITLDQDGVVRRIKGIPQRFYPRVPKTPEYQLTLAEIAQTWFSNVDLKIENNAVHTVSMSELTEMKEQIADLYDLVTIERLRNNANASDPAAKKGVFVDPFLDDDMRDQGEPQTAAIVNGELMLPISETIVDIGGATMETLKTLPYEDEVIVSQPMFTGDMAVNPYQAFEPIPPKVKLTPQVDRWTAVETTWKSSVTRRFTRWISWWQFWRWGEAGRQTRSTSIEQVGTRQKAAEFLRQRTVNFKIENFGPNEKLTQILFDGISVSFQ